MTHYELLFFVAGVLAVLLVQGVRRFVLALVRAWRRAPVPMATDEKGRPMTYWGGRP